MSSIKNRLIAIAKHFGISNRQFELSVGLGNGYINNAPKTISNKVAERILEKYSNINRVWLLTGEGEMLRNANEEHPPNESAGTSTMGDMIKIIHELQRTIRDMLDELQQLRAEVRKEREAKEYYMKLYQQSLEALGKETESRGVSPDEASARI